MLVGIDPGVDGAIALIDHGPRVVALWPCEPSMLRHVDVERAIVESQWAMPRQGRSAIAAQMRNYGRVIGACEALGVRMLFVQPGQWKRVVGLNRKHRHDVGDRRDDPVTLSQSRWK